jgi:hypothetical protein
MRHVLHRATARCLVVCASIASGAFVAAACGGHSNSGPSTLDGAAGNPQHGGADGSQSPTGDDASEPGSDVDGQAPGADGGAGEPSGDGSTPYDGGAGEASAFHFDGGYPAGWLYTSGAKIYESNGTGGGTQWMGRGVNVDDLFMCGYDNTLWLSNAETALEQEYATLMAQWKPSFVRISLSMDSEKDNSGNPFIVSWLSDPSQYKTPMTSVISALAGYPGVHVLVTLRSDASMIGQDTGGGDPEATGIPSSSATTPSATKYPTGTDAVYVALVDTFGTSGAVMFGLTNEPGGNTASNSTIAAAMNHAVGVIRAEETRLGVPHHIVSVQGNSWTSDIAFYATANGTTYPDGGTGLITYDDVVFEVHGYPPTASEYTFPNIPVIIGEYGSLPTNDAGTDPAFFSDLETKQIPSLAWDFDSYNDCAPDLVNVNQSSTSITPTTPWGTMLQAYLLAHAP